VDRADRAVFIAEVGLIGAAVSAGRYGLLDRSGMSPVMSSTRPMRMSDD
jgi:hypothetical protein